MSHNYGLSWIDQDKLFEVTEHAFEKAINDRKIKPKTPPDPFTLIAQAAIMGSDLEDVLEFETARKLNKTLSNEVGLWHQHVLGLAPGWQDLGSAGGGVDLKMCPGNVSARFGKPIVAEVKNRYNTIKASDEKNIWDDLDFAAKTHGAIAYIFQIVPKDTNRYDRPWKVSGRVEKDTVRCCDGVTAYEMVFGKSDALFELYDALPEIFEDVLAASTSQIDSKSASKIYYVSMPF